MMNAMAENVSDEVKLLAVAIKFSEGQNPQVIDRVAREVENQPEIMLLDLRRRSESDSTTLKFVGRVRQVLRAFRRAVDSVFEVVPPRPNQLFAPLSSVLFIPVRGLTVEDCQRIARKTARELSAKYSLPVFYFMQAAASANPSFREKLNQWSREQLEEGLRTGAIKPDVWEKRAANFRGITLVGVRKYIVNILFYLDTINLDVAQALADEISYRGRVVLDKQGKPMKDEQGNFIRRGGRFSNVDAMATSQGESDLMQIICNVKDYDNPNLVTLYQALGKLADEYMVEVLGSNILGFVPLAALHSAIAALWNPKELSKYSLSKQLNRLIQYMNINIHDEFVPQWQVIDFHFIKYS